MKNSIGIMQGRLTPSPDGKLQFFPAENWEAEFYLAKEIGFYSIEWNIMYENFGENPILLEEKVGIINNLQKNFGVKINSLCADIFCECILDQLSCVVLKLLIRQAAKIGAKQIIIPFLGKNEITPENREEISKQVSLVLITAKDYDIKLAFETSLPACELLPFITEFHSNHASVCYDVGNCTAFGFDAPEEIKMLGDLISEVHIKDRKKNNGPNIPLGTGDVDFSAVFKALKEINFKGPLVLETPRVPEEYAQGAEKYFDFVKKFIA